MSTPTQPKIALTPSIQSARILPQNAVELFQNAILKVGRQRDNSSPVLHSGPGRRPKNKRRKSPKPSTSPKEPFEIICRKPSASSAQTIASTPPLLPAQRVGCKCQRRET